MDATDIGERYGSLVFYWFLQGRTPESAIIGAGSPMVGVIVDVLG